jgi:glutathione synthase
MAQRYIPEIVEGDKRILMINGEPFLIAWRVFLKMVKCVGIWQQV